MTNDPAYYGYLEWYSISGSILSLGGTLTTAVTKWSGATIGDIGVIFDYVDSSNFWIFVVDYAGPPGGSMYKQIPFFGPHGRVMLPTRMLS